MSEIDAIMAREITEFTCEPSMSPDIVKAIRAALEAAGYVIRRSDEEQEPYGMLPVFKASER